MKLRFYRDSLRLRLTPADVRQLRDAGAVQESTGFAPGVELICWLTSDADDAGSGIRAKLEGCTVEVSVPRSQVHAWAGSNAVSIEATQPIGPGRSLTILIEKDFECLHDPQPAGGEAYFPNPEKARC